jgi:hypothetical protein
MHAQKTNGGSPPSANGASPFLGVVLASLFFAVIARPSPVRAVETSPAAEQQAALLSIYYHALLVRKELPNPNIRAERCPPTNLTTAAEILAKDHSADGVSRRRRAIAVLAGSSQPANLVEDWRPRELRDALRTLAGTGFMKAFSSAWLSLSSRHHRMTTARTPGPGMHPDSSPPAAATPPGPTVQDDPMAMEQTALNILNQAGSVLPPRCCTCLQVYDFDPPPETAKVAMAFFNMTITRPSADVSAAIDPRCWTKCNSDFFKATNLVVDCSGSTVPMPSPQPCGTAVLNGCLFEHVEYTPTLGCPNFNSPTVLFKNILKVDTLMSTNYEMDYALALSKDSKLPCQGSGSGQIDVDSGCAIAEPALAGTRMRGVKYVKFADPTLANWTVVGLRGIVDEIQQVGVCCGAPAPAPGECHECAMPQLDENPGCPCASSATNSCPP